MRRRGQAGPQCNDPTLEVSFPKKNVTIPRSKSLFQTEAPRFLFGTCSLLQLSGRVRQFFQPATPPAAMGGRYC